MCRLFIRFINDSNVNNNNINSSKVKQQIGQTFIGTTTSKIYINSVCADWFGTKAERWKDREG